MDPILKWAGGKRQLIPQLKKVIGDFDFQKNSYYEPFFGGGALFFNLNVRRAVISDLNSEIMNLYSQIKSNLDELVVKLNDLSINHCDEQFYRIRSLDRTDDFQNMSDVEKAARTLYLNKTCYNGLYRVNRKGQFNTPSGKYKNIRIFDFENLKEVSKRLNSVSIKIKSSNYENVVKYARKGSLIYFDPPYDYETSGFVNYSKEGFSKYDLEHLKDISDILINRGCIVIISNNDTEFVRSLFQFDKKYTFYNIHDVNAKRNINCNGKKRGNVKEVIIYGKKV